MNVEIKCRFTSEVLFAGEYQSTKEAVERAAKARANLSRANLSWADLSRVRGEICNSHELLASIAVRFDSSLTVVAATIAGRLVGCWSEYTTAIRQYFGEDTMRRLWQAWSQDESWGCVKKMRQYGWPEPTTGMQETQK